MRFDLNYDTIFDKNPNADFFYNSPSYSQYNKMVVGRVNLKNATERLEKREYYTFVTYAEGEELPKGYKPMSGLESDDGTLFATVDPEIGFHYICYNGGIQTLSRLGDLESGSPNYLLGAGTGPGPETIALVDIVNEQYKAYCESKVQGNVETPVQK